MASKPETNEIITSTELIIASTQSTSTITSPTIVTTSIAIIARGDVTATHITSSSTIKPTQSIHLLRISKNPRLNWRHKLLKVSQTSTAKPLTLSTLHPKPVKHEPQTSENALQKTLDYNVISGEDIERNESAVGVIQRTLSTPTLMPTTATTTTERTTTPEPSNYYFIIIYCQILHALNLRDNNSLHYITSKKNLFSDCQQDIVPFSAHVNQIK